MNMLLMLISLMNLSLKEDKVVISKTYALEDPTNMTVIVDNIFGDVTVENSEDNRVHLYLEIQISGYSDELVEKGKKELQLGQLLTDDSLVFYTKAPFVKKCGWRSGGWGYDMRDEPAYGFKYQYKLKVPKGVKLEAKTINKGDVVIKNVDGPIKASNVNGELEIKNARQVLQASTVNGDVTIQFIESPKEPIQFNTVNGDFNFELPENFSAQVYFNSMHGELYTAFDYRRMKPKIEKSEKNGTYKIGTKTGVEIGSGGPELSFRSINGDVYLKKAEIN